MKKSNKKKQPKKSTALIKREIPETPSEIMSNLLLKGDLSNMTPDQRVTYALHVGKSLGLNMATKPFDLITLSGKMVLYSNKNCAEQLRKLYGVSVIDQKIQKIDEIFVTTVQLQDKQGRTDTGTGAVNVAGLKGEALANAMMKSETKAKRRGTLSICGLGMLDETEIETIPNAQPIEFDYEAPKGEEKKTEILTPEQIEKVDSLSDYIKQGFTHLGYGKKSAFLFCEKFNWSDSKIKVEIDKIVAMKEGTK